MTDLKQTCGHFMRHMQAFRHSVIVRAASTRRKKTLKKCVLLGVSLNNTYLTHNNCSETCNGKNSLAISCDSFITPDQNCAFSPSLFPFYFYHVWQCEQIVYLYLWFKRLKCFFFFFLNALGLFPRKSRFSLDSLCSHTDGDWKHSTTGVKCTTGLRQSRF